MRWNVFHGYQNSSICSLCQLSHSLVGYSVHPVCCIHVLLVGSVQKTSSNASSTMESPHRRQDWIIVWCCEQQLITHTWAAPWNFYTIRADDGAVCIVWCCSVKCKYNVMISSTVDTSPDCNLVLFKQHMFLFILCALPTLLCFFFVVFAWSTDESTTQLGRSLWIFCAVILQFSGSHSTSTRKKRKGNSCITSLILFTFIWMRWWNDSSVFHFFSRFFHGLDGKKKNFFLFSFHERFNRWEAAVMLWAQRRWGKKYWWWMWRAVNLSVIKNHFQIRHLLNVGEGENMSGLFGWCWWP